MRWIGGLAAAALVVSLVGCVNADDVVETVTLSLAVPVDRADQMPPLIDAFVASVAKATGGAVRIKPVKLESSARDLGDGVSAGQRVIDGKFDMAITPTDSWDSLGVVSLEPLSLPIIMNPPTLKLVSDDALSAYLMEGLPDVGVTGLALWPVGLTHPFTSGAPLLTAAAFDGATIGTHQSVVLAAVYRAIGAQAVFSTQMAVTNWDSPLAEATTGTATGDLSFHPSVSVLVMNSTLSKKLTERSMEAITTAADAVRDAATMDAVHPEEDLGAQFCGLGGTIVLADPVERTRLLAAAGPVVEDVAADGDNAYIIDVIQRYDLGLPFQPANPCAPIDG